jgi:hypothetical protein
LVAIETYELYLQRVLPITPPPPQQLAKKGMGIFRHLGSLEEGLDGSLLERLAGRALGTVRVHLQYRKFYFKHKQLSFLILAVIRIRFLRE